MSCWPAKVRSVYDIHESIHDAQKLNHVGSRFTFGLKIAVTTTRSNPIPPTKFRATKARTPLIFIEYVSPVYNCKLLLSGLRRMT